MRCCWSFAVMMFLSLAGLRCGEDDRANVCQQAADQLMVCLGTEMAFDQAACRSNDQDLETAREVISLSCEDLKEFETTGGKEDAFCGGLLKILGFCKPKFPSIPCTSELGRAVANAVWKSSHYKGMVPSEWLYTSRNSWAPPWVDAPQLFPAMADLIASARFETSLETYEWDPWLFDKNDPSWNKDPTMVLVDGVQRLQDRLKQDEASGIKVTLPVKVRFIIDGRHPNALETQFGLAVDKIRSLSLQIRNANLDPRYVEVHLAVHQHMTWGAVHSKLLVVDGYKAILTGANPQRQQILGNHWHDSAYLVTGEIGIAMQRDFDDTWKRASEVQSCSYEHLDQPADCKLTSTSEIKHPPEVAAPNLSADPALANACVPMIAASRRPFDPRVPDPFFYNDPQDKAFLALVENARKVIKIESPDLNDPMLKQALLAAVKRGVEVRIILSLGFNSWGERYTFGPFSLGGSNEDNVPDLYAQLADPQACGRLQVRWYTKDKGSLPPFAQTPGASHAKYMTVDGQMAMIGSANQDKVSYVFVQESNALLDDAKATAAYDAAVFDADWEKAAKNDVLLWAAGIRDGSVDVFKDLDELLYGDAVGWAKKLLGSCGQ